MKSFFRRLLFILSITFMPIFLFSVKASILTNTDFIFLIDDYPIPYFFTTVSDGYFRKSIQFYNWSLLNGYSGGFNYVILDVCSNNLINESNISIENSGTNSYFDSNSILTYNTNISCKLGDKSYYGNLYKVQLFAAKYATNSDDGLYVASNLKIINSYSYNTYTYITNVVVSDSDVLLGLKQNNITNDLQRDILNQQKEFIEKQDETNKKLEDIESSIDSSTNSINGKLEDLNDNITSEDSPNLSGLSNSAGWLPAGPLDSILNLPLSFLQNLFSNLSKSCQAVTLPLPYVNKSIQLPCLNTIYSEIDGLSAWVNGIGVIASAFMLFSYLIKLYKWVDDTLTFRENNHLDNWGGI